MQAVREAREAAMAAVSRAEKAAREQTESPFMIGALVMEAEIALAKYRQVADVAQMERAS